MVIEQKMAAMAQMFVMQTAAFSKSRLVLPRLGAARLQLGYNGF
jgi:hypothetical protein